jgi:hypothetical protein
VPRAFVEMLQYYSTVCKTYMQNKIRLDAEFGIQIIIKLRTHTRTRTGPLLYSTVDTVEYLQRHPDLAKPPTGHTTPSARGMEKREIRDTS